MHFVFRVRGGDARALWMFSEKGEQGFFLVLKKGPDVLVSQDYTQTPIGSEGEGFRDGGHSL